MIHTLPVREALPGVDPVADARFMLSHPDVAHSPLHCRQIVAGLLAQHDEMLATFQELRDAESEAGKARGGPWVTHAVPREIQRRVAFSWNKVNAFIAKAQGSAV